MIGRRSFVRLASAAAAAPLVLSGRARGAAAANNRITVGCIGTGRMGRGNLKSILDIDEMQVVAVCDVDRQRCRDARTFVERRYAERKTRGQFDGCKEYSDFRELLARPDIDAVSIATPDHWHAVPAIEAARRGKDIYLEKPLTYTIHEGRVLSDTVQRYGRILQVGSWQRSGRNFRFACELVRNGRIGKILKVEVGCGIDPGTGYADPMPVPEALDYDMWLGPAPWAPYTEKRVHPPKGYGRPGWLRVRDYTVGMMTGWGSHHVDIAQWGLGTGDTGPVMAEGWAEYRDGLWDVHGRWDAHYRYANGVDLYFGDNKRYRQGAKFYGTEGWVYVRRGRIDAHPQSLLREKIGANEIHLYESGHHMRNFLDGIRTRAETVAPVENGHRSCTICVMADIAARLGRKLKWDPVREQFENDDTANRMLYRPMRAPWAV